MPREAVLCAWGITEEGRKVRLHLAPGTKEDTPSCTAFFEDLKRRGLPDPLLVVTDGAPGLIRAVETCFPRALRQRCLAHRMRNLRGTVPEATWPDVALRARACDEAAAPALAVRCFLDDFDACIAPVRRGAAPDQGRAPHAFGERPVLKLLLRRRDPRGRALAGSRRRRVRAPTARSRPFAMNWTGLTQRALRQSSAPFRVRPRSSYPARLGLGPKRGWAVAIVTTEKDTGPAAL